MSFASLRSDSYRESPRRCAQTVQDMLGVCRHDFSTLARPYPHTDRAHGQGRPSQGGPAFFPARGGAARGSNGYYRGVNLRLLEVRRILLTVPTILR